MNTMEGAKFNSLLTRVVVGAAYFVVVVGCLYLGPAVTAGVVSLMGCLCAVELLRLMRSSGRQPNESIAAVATILYPLLPLTPVENGATLVTIALFLSCAAWYVFSPRCTITDVALTFLVPVYCGFAFSSLTIIRMSDPGVQGFLLTFAVAGSVWLNDAVAYFVGTRFGKHKLAPRISPNKSYEGFWGGLVACMLIWSLLPLMHVQGIKWAFALPCGLAVGLAAVLGDLFESRIKRGFNVKDSGTLLPGHGGMLDRSDALLFGSMTALLLLRIGGIV